MATGPTTAARGKQHAEFTLGRVSFGRGTSTPHKYNLYTTLHHWCAASQSTQARTQSTAPECAGVSMRMCICDSVSGRTVPRVPAEIQRGSPGQHAPRPSAAPAPARQAPAEHTHTHIHAHTLPTCLPTCPPSSPVCPHLKQVSVPLAAPPPPPPAPPLTGPPGPAPASAHWKKLQRVGSCGGHHNARTSSTKCVTPCVDAWLMVGLCTLLGSSSVAQSCNCHSKTQPTAPSLR